MFRSGSMSELLVFRFFLVFKFGYGRYIKESLLSLFSRCHARGCEHPVQVATHEYVSDLLYVMLLNVTRSDSRWVQMSIVSCTDIS